MGGTINQQLKAVLGAFNAAMRERPLGPLRHQLELNSETKQPYASAVNGTDSTHITNDWAKMAQETI